VVSTRAEAKVYCVSVVGGRVGKKVLEPQSISQADKKGVKSRFPKISPPRAVRRGREHLPAELLTPIPS
jgi:hypothetical protein